MNPMTSKFIKTLVFLSALTVFGCTVSSNRPKEWAETTGIITDSAKMDDGSYAYTLTYDARESIAINMDGHPIKGPISKHFYRQDQKAVQGQKVKMFYSTEEPITINIISDIQFE